MSSEPETTSAEMKRKREETEDLSSPPPKKIKTSETNGDLGAQSDPASNARNDAMVIDSNTPEYPSKSATSWDAKLLKVFPSLLFPEKNSASYCPVNTDHPLFLAIPYIEDLKFLILTVGSVSKQTRQLVFLPGPAWTKSFRRIFGSDNFNDDNIEFSTEFKNYQTEFEQDTTPIAFYDTTHIAPATYLERILVFKGKNYHFDEFDGCPLWEADGWVDFCIDFFGDAFWYAHAEGCGRAGEYNANNDLFGEGRLIVRSKAWLKGEETIFFDEVSRSCEEEEEEEEDENIEEDEHEDGSEKRNEEELREEKVQKNFQEEKSKKEGSDPVPAEKLAAKPTDKLAQLQQQIDESETATKERHEKEKLARMPPKERCVYEHFQRFGGKLPLPKGDDRDTGIYLVAPYSREIQGGRLIFDLSSNMEW